MHKLRERLGQIAPIDAPFPPKPKGMHWRTYHRLEALDEELSMQWYSGVSGLIGKYDK